MASLIPCTYIMDSPHHWSRQQLIAWLTAYAGYEYPAIAHLNKYEMAELVLEAGK